MRDEGCGSRWLNRLTVVMSAVSARFQLVEVLLALAEFLAVAHDGHQYGSFAFRYSCGGLYGGFVLCHNSSRIEKKGIPRKEIPLLLIRTSEGRTVRGTVSGGR